jgi:hypothetical protein
VVASPIPRGVVLKIVRWSEQAGGEKFHARYILTDIGGVRFDVGLDSGDPGQTTDVSLLDFTLYRQRWDDYQQATAEFKYEDEVVVLGTA